jgi:hypothetical protein
MIAGASDARRALRASVAANSRRVGRGEDMGIESEGWAQKN